jgi:hypothetical protein
VLEEVRTKGSYAYLLQISPVMVIASCWLAEICWAGLEKSPMFEKVIAHLKVGAQKKTRGR